jgi:biopolymer transport protein ExbD
MASSTADTQPIATINITPLIDVMLVLLIMMILTIPTMTHKVSIDLPQNGPPSGPMVSHRLTIAASGALTLDGAVIGEAALADKLAPIADDKQALLTVDTDSAARYETFDRVLATVKKAGVTRLGFVGNDRFAGAF